MISVTAATSISKPPTTKLSVDQTSEVKSITKNHFPSANYCSFLIYMSEFFLVPLGILSIHSVKLDNKSLCFKAHEHQLVFIRHNIIESRF